jgi:hypothetical protein
MTVAARSRAFTARLCSRMQPRAIKRWRTSARDSKLACTLFNGRPSFISQRNTTQPLLPESARTPPCRKQTSANNAPPPCIPHLADGIRRWTQPHIESRAINLLNALLIGILEALPQPQTHQNPELTSRHRTVEYLNQCRLERAVSAHPHRIVSGDPPVSLSV